MILRKYNLYRGATMTLPKYILIQLAGLLFVSSAFANDITIGYQTGIEPAKVAIANGDYEKASGEKIHWRRFDNGAELIRAIASGDIVIGNVGSTVVATAASHHLPIQAFLIASQLGASEALVVRNNLGINHPEDLIGKTIAVPFVSTSHYSLLAALKHWGIEVNKVKIINLRISEIPAAWQRGDIDAAYVWEPALGKIKESGSVMATSGDVGKWGAPTFDLWVVNNDFAEKHKDFLKKFTQTALEKINLYYANPDDFSKNATNLENIAKITGAKTSDINELLGSDNYPLANKQSQLLTEQVTKAIADSASFLKAQGKIDVLLTNYNAYVTDTFISNPMN